MAETKKPRAGQRGAVTGRKSQRAAAAAPPLKGKETKRFAQKRELVINTATHIMNDRGVHGLTFVEVAQKVGLSTSSVTYYFRLKEQLAAAAYEETLSRIEALVKAAGAEATPKARVRAYMARYFDLHCNINKGQEKPIAILSDIRALEDAARIPLTKHYVSIFRHIRNYFDPPRSDEHRALNTARAQVLTEGMYWLPAWIFEFAYSDLDRAQARLFDLFENGLAIPGAAWAPQVIPLDRESGVAKGRGNFMRVATRVIGERGYRGASVERIAAELNVTKGSFYHHLEAKDDLVLDCFRHSYATIAAVVRSQTQGSRWHHLTSVIATLLELQLNGEWPLMRTTALQTLPPDVRPEAVDRASRMAFAMSGIIADGIAEGSIRAVDPFIAAQAIMPGLNAAYEQHNMAGRLANSQRAIELYASTLVYGLFDDRML